jgi:hypothetical protein
MNKLKQLSSSAKIFKMSYLKDRGTPPSPLLDFLEIWSEKRKK